MEAGWLDPTDLSKALLDVMNERDRQWNEENFDPAHDDKYGKGVLAAAGACYALYSDAYPNAGQPPKEWPWAAGWWKPKDYRRDLVRAAALLIAEIERIDRAEKAAKP
ncbi:MAG: hypothetical protein EOR21_08590 [Mesorhizobium sp.]|nr:MAG: hypothetical protein EOR21_08590 [Mesorhizobium sp.]